MQWPRAGWRADLALDVTPGSFLAMLPRDVRAELLSMGVPIDVPAHGLVNRPGARPVEALLVDGVLRTYAIVSDGREFTLMYARRGAWLGVPLLPEGPFPCLKEALCDARVLRIPNELVHRLAATEARFGWAVAAEIANTLYRVYDGVARHILAPLADRVAHHLLESGSPQQDEQGLVSPLKQQELADAVGSPRESVARTLRGFRNDGLVRLIPSGIRILKPDELRRRIRPGAWHVDRLEPSTHRRSSIQSPPASEATDYGETLARAIERSVFARLPVGARRRVIDSGLRLDIPAGSVLYRAGEPGRNGLLVSGLVRSFAVAPDGRQFTLVYLWPGSWLGLPTVAGGPYPLDVEAVTDIIALEFPADLIERLALSEPLVAWSIAEELTRRVYHGFDVLAAHVFAPVAERIAHRLLEFAVRRSAQDDLVATLGVAELADGIGATPSSTGRILRQLSAAGVIRPVRGGIRILKPEALAPRTWA
jgi:CRP/FNR family transcriptional regulator